VPLALSAPDNRRYYDVLRQFAAHLRDGHTSVWYPGSYYQDVYAYAPLQTDLIGGKVLITRLLNDTLAQQGLKKGMEVLQVNGIEVKEYARKNILPYEGASTPQGQDFYLYKAYLLNGPVDEPLRLTVKDRTGKVTEVAVSRRLKKTTPPVIRFSVLPGNVGLLAINGFTAPDFNRQFDSLYPQLLQTRALIIDLRDNSGGNGSQGVYMMKHFVTRPFPDPLISSRQYNPLLKLWGFQTAGFYSIAAGDNAPFTDRTIYTKPIALLIGKTTASAAEDFAMPFDYVKRGPLIGQPTSGSTGQPMVASLPGGGTLRICVRRDSYPDGRAFVGVGIQPTIAVAEDAAAFQRGEDRELQKALEVLKQGIEKG
jgi:carboxyl-terminal processing protease